MTPPPPKQPSPNADDPWLALQARVRKFGPKLLQLLAEWTETFPRDFQEESTIGHLKDVVGRIAPCDEVGEPGQSPFNLSPPSRLGPEPVPRLASGPSSPHPHPGAPLKSAPSCPIRESGTGRAGREIRLLGLDLGS